MLPLLPPSRSPDGSPHHTQACTSSLKHCVSSGSHWYHSCRCLNPFVSLHGRGCYPHKYNLPPPCSIGSRSSCYSCNFAGCNSHTCHSPPFLSGRAPAHNI